MTEEQLRRYRAANALIAEAMGELRDLASKVYQESDTLGKGISRIEEHTAEAWDDIRSHVEDTEEIEQISTAWIGEDDVLTPSNAKYLQTSSRQINRSLIQMRTALDRMLPRMGAEHAAVVRLEVGVTAMEIMHTSLDFVLERVSPHNDSA